MHSTVAPRRMRFARAFIAADAAPFTNFKGRIEVTNRMELERRKAGKLEHDTCPRCTEAEVVSISVNEYAPRSLFRQNFATNPSTAAANVRSEKATK